MITKIDHIGIAVSGLKERMKFWSEALGLEIRGIETVDSEQVRVGFLDVGPSRIELLEPTDETSTVARYLSKHGEGIHHLTLAVDDLDALLADLKRRGVALVGDAPRPGAEGSRVAFLHPRSTGGVLLELVERPVAPEPDEFVPGATVLAYLRDPQEKLWGVLKQLDPAGAVIHGLDLGSFDDWVAQVENKDEMMVGPSVLFIPMSRVERIILDRPTGELPSMAERFLSRTGKRVQDAL